MPVYTHPEKHKILAEWLEGGKTQQEVAARFGLTPTTLYLWKKRLEETGHLENRYAEGKNHHRALADEVINQILSAVAERPDLSAVGIYELLKTRGVDVGYKGVQRTLERYNLRTIEDRKLYRSEAGFQPVQDVTPVAQVPEVRPIPQLTIQHIPAPPAQLSASVSSPNARIPKRSFPLFFITFFALAGSAIIAGSILTAETFLQFAGLIFAFLALTAGMVFFVYSLKYYFTVAIVLFFSRRVGSPSLSGAGSGDVNQWNNLKASDGTARESTISRQGSPGSGLVPDLSHVALTRFPFVSVHIPLYNEKRVVNRLLDAVTSIDYIHPGTGKPHFEVVVCDDSTDETRAIVADWRNHPLVKISQRENREGFKGGALREGLKFTDPRTEFILVFDADFLPYPDTISSFLKYFQVVAGGLDFSTSSTHQSREFQIDSRYAAVQGYQWHVLNKSENWITRGVRSEYAGSYVIERSGSEIYHGLKQIAGSVFMIRADIIRNPAYTWGKSITEDWELTLKLYRDGYKVIYTPYIQAPSECVSTLKRLIRQRMRWAEGHSHNVKKMFEEFLSSQHPTRGEKLEFLYLAPYYMQSFLFLLGTFSWFVSETVFKVRIPYWTEVWGWSLVLTNLLSLPLMNTVGLFLEESEEKDYAGIPSFILLSYILAPFQAYASIKGFLESTEGPWFRTPKTGKITDIYRRGKFYRWLSGIFGSPAEARLSEVSADKSGLAYFYAQRPHSNYLSLATSNNHFDSFAISRHKSRRIGKTAVALVVLAAMMVNYLGFAASKTQAAAPGGEWWNGSYNYRQKITITAGSVNAPTSYSIRIQFDHADLVTNRGALASGNDLRIAYWNGSGWTELDRSLDDQSSWNTTTTQVWFRTQAAINASASDDNYYMYYGNSGAGTPPTTWSNIFLFYDDFADGTLDTGRWACDLGTCTESGGTLTLGQNSRVFATSTYAIGTSTRWEARLQLGTGWSGYYDHWLASPDNNFASGNYVGYWTNGNAPGSQNADNALSGSSTNTGFTQGTPGSYHLYTFNRETTAGDRYLVDGGQVANHTTNIPTGSYRAVMWNDNVSASQVIDFVRVRNYVTSEPTTAFASEEQVPELVLLLLPLAILIPFIFKRRLAYES